MGGKMGLSSTTQISTLVGTVVFFFVFVPSLIAALNTLGIEAISKPATEMLGIMMAAIPDILATTAILIVTYFIAKFAADIVEPVLDGVGINSLPKKMGFTAMSEDVRPSAFAGKLIMFFAILFASVEAADKLAHVCHSILKNSYNQ